MSVELRIRLPKKIYDMLEEKAKRTGLSINDLIIYIISKVIEE